MFRFQTKDEVVELSRRGSTLILRTEKTFASPSLAQRELERLAAVERKKSARASKKTAPALPPEAAKLLAVLDAAHERGHFPFPLHDRMDYAGMRLHAYRGKAGSALVFEMVMFDREQRRIEGGLGFRNYVFVFSDRGALHVWSDLLLPINIEATKEPHTFLLRRKRVTVPAGSKAPGDILRYLVDHHAKAVFSSDIERAKLMKGRLLFLRVPEWHYRFATPSDLEAMRQLATALALDEPSAYEPKAKPNTDWRKMEKQRVTAASRS
jgi:hypothetical protein